MIDKVKKQIYEKIILKKLSQQSTKADKTCRYSKHLETLWGDDRLSGPPYCSIFSGSDTVYNRLLGFHSVTTTFRPFLLDYLDPFWVWLSVRTHGSTLRPTPPQNCFYFYFIHILKHSIWIFHEKSGWKNCITRTILWVFPDWKYKKAHQLLKYLEAIFR